MTDNPDWNERLDAMQQRMEDHFENEMRLLTELRTRQVVQQQEIQALQEASRLELAQIQGMRENLLIQSKNINQLTQAVADLAQIMR